MARFNMGAAKRGAVTGNKFGSFLGAQVGFLGGGLFGGDTDEEKAFRDAQGNIRRARTKLNQDFAQLLADFDMSIGGLRSESQKVRSETSAKIRAESAAETDKLISGLGPLNESTKAQIRLGTRAPITRQTMEFDLGTTQQDLNLALAGLMGSVQLERENSILNQQTSRVLRRNQAAFNAFQNAQPGFLEQILSDTASQAQLIAAFRGGK